MLLKIGAFLTAVVSFIAALFFARREGQKAEQVANLRREIERNAKEQERANAINNAVSNMSDSDVNDRLQNISSKQR